VRQQPDSPALPHPPDARAATFYPPLKTQAGLPSSSENLYSSEQLPALPLPPVLLPGYPPLLLPLEVVQL
jgi:hypothetical protein